MKEQLLEEVIYFVIERTMKRVKQYSMVHFQANNFEITIDQWVMLKRIEEVPGISLVDLAESTYKDPASITRMVDVLNSKGFVEKRMDKLDRRKYGLYTTTKGKELHDHMLDIAVKIRKEGIAGISETELTHMKDTLNKIYKNMEAVLGQ